MYCNTRLALATWIAFSICASSANPILLSTSAPTLNNDLVTSDPPPTTSDLSPTSEATSASSSIQFDNITPTLPADAAETTSSSSLDITEAAQATSSPTPIKKDGNCSKGVTDVTSDASPQTYPDVFSVTQKDRALCSWRYKADVVNDGTREPMYLRHAECLPCPACEVGPFGPTGWHSEPIYHQIRINKCTIEMDEKSQDLVRNCKEDWYTVSVGCICAQKPSS